MIASDAHDLQDFLEVIIQSMKGLQKAVSISIVSKNYYQCVLPEEIHCTWSPGMHTPTPQPAHTHPHTHNSTPSEIKVSPNNAYP